MIWTGTRTFVGSSPERHITLDAGNVVMNPISGTYRYPKTGPELPGVLDFLDDEKEAGELYMVLDEELKMMGRVCEQGGRAVGPHLKQMARIAHTEYLIEGRSSLDVRDILRETLFAPTVTGGPLESACRVISKFEPEGRDYYAGMVALIGRDQAGARFPGLGDPHPHRRHLPVRRPAHLGGRHPGPRQRPSGLGGGRDPRQGGSACWRC